VPLLYALALGAERVIGHRLREAYAQLSALEASLVRMLRKEIVIKLARRSFLISPFAFYNRLTRESGSIVPRSIFLEVASDSALWLDSDSAWKVAGSRRFARSFAVGPVIYLFDGHRRRPECGQWNTNFPRTGQPE
jgi:hypothetical protein